MSSTAVAIVGIVFALVAALVVTRLQDRRLRRLTDAIERFERDAGATSLRLAEADTGNDELSRLAAQVERLGARVQAQREALERAARQRTELLANVSHDLRTPLASMRGYIELLLLHRGDLDGAEAQNYLQTAARQSERLGRLVADLFDLTRLEAEGRRPDAEDFTLAELASDVAQKFELDARRRGVSLRACCTGTEGGAEVAAVPPLRVHAEIGLVERVLENLVENALRHTPAGGSVAIESRSDAGRAHVAVSDTGEGIAEADLAHLFERYDHGERTGSPTRGNGHGGLGLAIARRIVRLHGGELAVQSRPGSGTRVDFDLPLAAGKPLVEAPAPHHLAA